MCRYTADKLGDFRVACAVTIVLVVIQISAIPKFREHFN